MSQCSGINASGGRCRGQAIAGDEWCFSHHPDKEDQRRRRATKGGKRGGRGRPQGDLRELLAENADIRRRVLEGEIQPNAAAVAVQSINAGIRGVKVALDVREQEELAQEVEDLKTRIEHERAAYGT